MCVAVKRIKCVSEQLYILQIVSEQRKEFGLREPPPPPSPRQREALQWSINATHSSACAHSSSSPAPITRVLTFPLCFRHFQLLPRWQANITPTGGCLFSSPSLKSVGLCMVGFSHTLPSRSIQPCCSDNRVVIIFLPKQSWGQLPIQILHLSSHGNRCADG